MYSAWKVQIRGFPLSAEMMGTRVGGAGGNPSCAGMTKDYDDFVSEFIPYGGGQ